MYYIKQTSKSDCGFTCIKILLANVLKNKDYLFIPRKEDKKNYNFLEMSKLSSKYGVNLLGVNYSGDLDLRKVDHLPCIISLDLTSGVKHAVVLMKRRGNKFLVFDPYKGKKWITNLTLTSSWDGNLLFVESVCVKPNKPTLFDNLVSKAHLVILHSLQIISACSLIVATYFIDGTYNSLMYTGLFLGIYLISDIFFRYYLKRMHKLISKNFLNKLSSAPSDCYEFVARLSEYKKLFFLNKIKLISSIILGVFLSTIFIINNPLNSIVVGSCILLGMLDALLFNKVLKRKEEKLSIKEQDVNSTQDLYSFRSHIYKVEDSAVKISNLHDTFRAVILITLAGIIILTTILTKILSTVSFVFYLALAFTIFKMFSNIFSFNERSERLDIAKSKLANLTYNTII